MSEVDPLQLNPDDFLAIDMLAHWSDLRPLLETPPVRRVLEAGMAAWVAQNQHLAQLTKGEPWRLSQALRGRQPAPWRYAVTDLPFIEVEDELEAALKHDDFHAVLALHAQSVAIALEEIGTDNYGVHQRLVEQLSRIGREAYARFAPQPSAGPAWWLPVQSCHIVGAPVALALARAWLPSFEWQIVSNEQHSMVVDVPHCIVFDLLWHPHVVPHPFDLFRPPADADVRTEIAGIIESLDTLDVATAPARRVLH